MVKQQQDTPKMDSQSIRNFSIISHVDHGKTTLSDHLIAQGGMIPDKLAGTMRALDFLPEEQKRGITIETSLVTFTINHMDHDYIVNLIDTPGHVDFSGKVAESLRLVDTGLILVDAVEGVMAQTKTVLKQAISEGLKLILFINKLDRLITELRLTPSEIRKKIERIIGEVGSICLLFNYPKNELPSFSKGTAIFGSALDGWAINSEYARKGGKLEGIINDYDPDLLAQTSKLSKVFIPLIAEKFISPKDGQARKFPLLFSEPHGANTMRMLRECDPAGDTILCTGRLFRVEKSHHLGYIVRLFSGTIRQGQKLKSSLTDDVVQISRIVRFQGRNIHNIKQLQSGNVGGVILNKRIQLGDVLIDHTSERVNLKRISYVQEPVVAISIEPTNLAHISRIEDLIASITEITPGLDYEVNSDTGELIAFGVGTLQLDILVQDLFESRL